MSVLVIVVFGECNCIELFRAFVIKKNAAAFTAFHAEYFTFELSAELLMAFQLCDPLEELDDAGGSHAVSSNGRKNCELLQSLRQENGENLEEIGISLRERLLLGSGSIVLDLQQD